jgi:hypothetical protein
MITKLKEWLISFFRKEEKKIKLKLNIPSKPNIQRVLLDGFKGLECGWYIIRWDATDETWEVITGPET